MQLVVGGAQSERGKASSAGVAGTMAGLFNTLRMTRDSPYPPDHEVARSCDGRAIPLRSNTYKLSHDNARAHFKITSSSHHLLLNLSTHTHPPSCATLLRCLFLMRSCAGPMCTGHSSTNTGSGRQGPGPCNRAPAHAKRAWLGHKPLRRTSAPLPNTGPASELQGQSCAPLAGDTA